MKRTTAAILAASVAACASPLGHMTRPPSMTAPGAPRDPLPSPAAARLATPPRHEGTGAPATSGSLWRSGPESLFGDRRARRSGDIVTVVVEIDEEAEFKNSTERQRGASENISVPALLGAGSLAQRILPGGAGLDPAIEAQSSSSSSGDGAIKRQEKITLRIAATVVDVLPNGHLAIVGSQELRVNYELRDLQVAGIIRPEDISRTNIITYDKIADARISYGGRGQLTDVQKARYGQQILELVSPF